MLVKSGFKVRLGKSCNSRWYSFAGTDQIRANDINEFFQDQTIGALLCLRGGYGSIRLLDLIDYRQIEENPKIFVGYSDITALHLSLNQQARLITFHGPMFASNLASDFDPVSQNSLEQMLSNNNYPLNIENPSDQPLKTLRSGKAVETLIGGNLATLISLLGTSYQPDFSGKILFLEEVGEATYRIDRALSQLALAGILSSLSGIILGDFKNCHQSAPADMTLMEVFEDILVPLDIPIIYNLRSGHCRPMVSLPLGAKAKVNSDPPQIEILENVVG